MFYGDTVQDTRKVFFTSWLKYRQKLPLEPLEEQLVHVILDHPEYHAMLEIDPSQADRTFFPELGQTNPFLHMGLHLALREQIATNRPVGIAALYQNLVTQYADSLHVEHLMIDHLAECLWQAQHAQTMPNETAYLAALTGLLN
ncbi:MAG: DUF1841 family protein [Tatlockia sp.]